MLQPWMLTTLPNIVIPLFKLFLARQATKYGVDTNMTLVRSDFCTRLADLIPKDNLPPFGKFVVEVFAATCEKVAWEQHIFKLARGDSETANKYAEHVTTVAQSRLPESLAQIAFDREPAAMPNIKEVARSRD